MTPLKSYGGMVLNGILTLRDRLMQKQTNKTKNIVVIALRYLTVGGLTV
jgi:hypothetical protein